MKRAVIRLPREVVDRLDRLTAELRLAHPEESYSRASVARALISGGLGLVTSVETGAAERAVTPEGELQGARDERVQEGVASRHRPWPIDLARRGARSAARRDEI